VIGTSGLGTITSAPPVAYPDVVPPDPNAAAARPDARRERLMNPDESARAEAMRLRDRLEREARGNYVDIRVIRDPKPRFAFTSGATRRRPWPASRAIRASRRSRAACPKRSSGR
jgi:hypothetical protein